MKTLLLTLALFFAFVGSGYAQVGGIFNYDDTDDIELDQAIYVADTTGTDRNLHMTGQGLRSWIIDIDSLSKTHVFNDHDARHEDGGADEMNVQGLAGELAAPQKSTVEEADGTPTVLATTIQFNQADGFRVTDETGGQAQVDFDDSGIATAFTAQQYFSQATLTDAATIAWDLEAAQVAIVTLGGNRTLGAPTNQQAGSVYTLLVRQDGTGSRTLAFNAVYKFPGGTDPTPTTDAGAEDMMSCLSDGTSMYCTWASHFQ